MNFVKRIKSLFNKKEEINVLDKLIKYFLIQFSDTKLKKTGTVTNGFGPIEHYHSEPRKVSITSEIGRIQFTCILWGMNPEDASLKLPKLLQTAAELYAEGSINLGIHIYVKDTLIDKELNNEVPAMKYLNELSVKVLNRSFESLIIEELNKIDAENNRLLLNTQMFLDEMDLDMED